jgi:hypothetical protein
MSFILMPNRGNDIKVNAWNWRPTIALLRQVSLINDEQHDLMGCNGCGGSVNPETARKIAEFLDQQLAKMAPGQRLRADLSITSEPKKPAVFTPNSKVEDFDASEIYSSTYEWLVMFRDFCRTCEGFRVS